MKHPETAYSVARDLGISDSALQRFGDFAVKVDHHIAQGNGRAGSANQPVLINVTGITPTTFGEGKTTVVIGLVDALRLRGEQAVGTIRQSSIGPTFNLKGAGVGGGKSQCVPRLPLILGLTGDFERIAQAQNLGMTALTARCVHESMYDDKSLQEKGLKRLGISDGNLSQSWSIDLCAQSLREIKLGMDLRGERRNISSGFVMTAATEVMTIFSLAKNLRELRSMLGKMEFAKDEHGGSVTADDLQVAGAMTVLLRSAFDPNLVLSQGASPILVHGGPFANISIGNSSIIADLVGASFAKMLVTESGFGADVGFEKMWNIKAQRSPYSPKVAVLVVTIRALKFLGKAAAFSVEPSETERDELNLIRLGFSNLERHLSILSLSGVVPVVCINKFAEDTANETHLVQEFCRGRGIRCASSEHFSLGGAGALELADMVIDASRGPAVVLNSIFASGDQVKDKIKKIVNKIYGIETVQFAELFNSRLDQESEKRDLSKYQVCMCKTPYSFTHDPKNTLRESGKPFSVTGVVFHHGAQLIIPICGSASFMPGTVSKPNFKQMDLEFPSEEATGI